MVATRECSACSEARPLDDFYKNVRYTDGYTRQCKRCMLEYQRTRNLRPGVRERKRELNAKYRKNRKPYVHSYWDYVRKAYGLTEQDFADILDAQGGGCAICHADEPGGKGRWHVDHDHSCCLGKTSCGECVRGLLCALCNPMLGLARDNVDTLASAIRYLAEVRK